MCVVCARQVCLELIPTALPYFLLHLVALPREWQTNTILIFLFTILFLFFSTPLQVQANLHMIEDESGALESSWQSLLSVQEVVTLLGTLLLLFS